MQSSEAYFMLGATHKSALDIHDPETQNFYNQLYSSLALQNKTSIHYLGMLG